ncbi:PREDICTED: uncharacterized protein LOC109240717 [Nicotiana attenuata]|uniref:uncharacterized protein LOC109240717 n=1 Tax=Nicotiana attenuata TaxID=49451 RepID=UPI000905C015|nr:PREDICTED: uncharacterized protein LOC109240717 [Nicotiana attenuata]
MAFLLNQFRIKDLGKLHYFLGQEMLYKSDGVLICQRKFTMDILKEYDCFAYSTAPREPHLKAAIHVLRYLKKDLTLGIFLSNDPSYAISAYCGSDWAACPDSRKSVSGYIVLLGDIPISWKSKKQTIVSLSSTEAEYGPIRKVVGELIWIKRLLEELIVMCTNPIPVFCYS